MNRSLAAVARQYPHLTFVVASRALPALRSLYVRLRLARLKLSCLQRQLEQRRERLGGGDA